MYDARYFFRAIFITGYLAPFFFVLVVSFGDDPEITGELVVRKRLALEENLGDSRACSDGDLRCREVGGAEGEAHHAL